MHTYDTHLLASPWMQTSKIDEARALNNTSTIVGSAEIPTKRALLWNPGPELLPLLGQSSVALGVNDSKDVVGVWQEAGSLDQPFLYRNGQMHNLKNVIGTKESWAFDINNSGFIVGSAGDAPATYRAFLYSYLAQAAPTDLGVLPGQAYSHATAINNNNQVAGVSGGRLFLYDGGMNDLGHVQWCYDINDGGQIVVSRYVGNYVTRGYVCQTSQGSPQFEVIPQLPGFLSCAPLGINNQGDVVGLVAGTATNLYEWRAFLRKAGEQPEDLTTLIHPNSGWDVLLWASAINDQGQIVGAGIYQGQNRAYLLTPVPEGLVIHDGPKFSVSFVSNDPLEMLVGEDMYRKIKLPTPSLVEIDILRARVSELVQVMGPIEGKRALARAKAYVEALEQELKRR